MTIDRQGHIYVANIAGASVEQFLTADAVADAEADGDAHVDADTDCDAVTGRRAPADTLTDADADQYLPALCDHRQERRGDAV